MSSFRGWLEVTKYMVACGLTRPLEIVPRDECLSQEKGTDKANYP